jgi:hypothetical protein
VAFNDEAGEARMCWQGGQSVSELCHRTILIESIEAVQKQVGSSDCIGAGWVEPGECENV